MRKRSAVALTIVVSVGALAMFFPFLWTIITSISSGAGLSATPQLIPEDPSLAAYAELFENTPFLQVIANSLGLAIATTLAQLATSALAAYAFSRLPFRGSNVVFAIYLATMMIPIQVLIVPLFIEIKMLGLLNTYVGVLLPGLASAFGVFLLRQAMNAVPRELDEAAKIDGAGHFRIFGTIVLPLIVLRTPELQTLPIALAGLQGQYTTQWDVLMAGSVISVIPMVLIYIFAQRYVIQGVANTGIK